MNDNDGTLKPEDYMEPRCLLCDEPYGSEKVKAIPQRRVLEKMDEYVSRRDFRGAERHLGYWIEEARLGGDGQGQLLVCNEFIGFYRKQGQKEKALLYADRAIALVEGLGLEGSVTAGTTYVNAGTACNAFGENGRALELFKKAQAEYESNSMTKPDQLGGLYNNMGLTYMALGDYDKAMELYEKAVSVMAEVPGGVLEQAITCLNMADVIAARDGAENGESEIFSLLDRAYDLLKDDSAPKNGYCAFVYEKCAPVFSHYGYFAAAEELKKLSEELYERA